MFGYVRVGRRTDGSLAIDQRTETLHIDIAAANENTYSLSVQLRLAFECRGKTQAAGRFHHDFHARCQESHAVHELRIGSSEHVIDVPPDNRKGVFAEMLGLRPVRNRAGRINVYDGSGTERPLAVIAGLRFNSVNIAFRCERECRRLTPPAIKR